ncbi:hypothetical protein EVAR_31819_1 [Eumeta japonica]|uniref:Uncharacterized protein n=1 Tax=Eumeta variegata TaxID=151549 RepID=A0A4C1WLU1_EUMVA|nr:hypothetical protein EVAR_31819_1 [Eumeta japonica]
MQVDISNNSLFRDHLESKVKLAPKMLESDVIRTSSRRHLWADTPQHQLWALDRIQRRASQIVGDPVVAGQLDQLAL